MASRTWRFVGVDPSAAMLGLARETAGPAVGDRLWLIQGEVADATEDTFDAATCILVMGLVPDDGAKLDLLREVRRRLKPGVPSILVDQCIDPAAADRYLRLDRYAAYARASGIDPETVAGARAMMEISTTFVGPARNEALINEAGFEAIKLFYLAMSGLSQRRLRVRFSRSVGRSQCPLRVAGMPPGGAPIDETGSGPVSGPRLRATAWQGAQGSRTSSPQQWPAPAFASDSRRRNGARAGQGPSAPPGPSVAR
jgi:SAM-dependent methyltransferase